MIRSESEVGQIAFLGDGSLAGMCADRKARVWEAKSGALERTVSTDSGDGSFTLLGTSSQLAGLGKDGVVKVWDLRTGEKVRRMAGPEDRIRNLCLARDLSLVAGSNRVEDNSSAYVMHVVDSTGRVRFDAAAGLGGVSAMAFHPNGETFAAASYDTSIRAWDTRKGELLKHVEEIDVATFTMAYSPDGRLLATAGVDRIVRLWDTRNWTVVGKLVGQPEMISSLAFSPDGRRILSGGFSELTSRQPVSVMLWETATGKMLRKLGAPQRVDTLAFSADGQLAAMSCRRKEVAIWEMSG
jgi:WD40 repeat protein